MIRIPVTTLVLVVSLSACLTAAEVKLGFEAYYDGPAVVKALKDLNRAYPDLTELKSIGKSEEGRDIWLLIINNPNTGADLSKPGIYADGAIHGNEIQATEVCLYLAWYLLKNYQDNPTVRELVDSRTFYIIPTVNVDNRARFFSDPGHFNIGRSARVSHDDDRDGLEDEDDYDDLDGDGQILQMRIRDKFGGFKTHPKDKRVMVPVEPGETGEWRVLGLEGIDNDGDGRLNEDPVGYLDMNRNFGFKWQPRYAQEGAGDFPMSSKPTKAVADFFISKPNICFAVAFHNYGGLLYRGPGSKLAGLYPPRDAKVWDFIGQEGEKIIPGYRYIVSFKEMYTTHGDFDEWVYSNLGIMAFVGELFMSRQEQYRNPTKHKKEEPRRSAFDRDVPEEERQKFNDFVNQGSMFSEWRKFTHPQFGEIEIGGWRKFTSRMPAPFMLPELVHRNASLVIFLARHAPAVELTLLEKKKLPGDLTRIRVRLSNPKAIPTLTDKSLRHNLARKDILRIEGPGITVVSGGVADDLQLEKVTPVEDRPQLIFLSVPSFGKTDVQWIVKGRGRAKVTYDSLKARNQALSIGI